MSKKVDLTGQKFGRLVVVEMLRRYKGKHTYCRCQCDCGNETIALMGNIKQGKTQSCGCYERESRFERKHYFDITNQKFGNLVAIRKTDEKVTNGSVIWECQCGCGNIRYASAGALRRGAVTSCGCRDFENVKADLTNQKFGMLTAISSTYKNNKTAWKCLCDCGNQVIVRTSDLTSGNTISCGCKKMSHKELHIMSFLDSNNVHYRFQYRIEDCKNERPLPFDFCIFNDDDSIKFLIEYNGEQHYIPIDFFGGEEQLKIQQSHDKIKCEYCISHNIPLLIIPYTWTDVQIENTILNYLDPVTITE